MSNPTKLLTELAPDSLRLSKETRMVRMDGQLPEVEQTYLTINGTPDAFRWLASQLNSMARCADRNAGPNSVIISPVDLKQITMTEWSSIDLGCWPGDMIQ